MQQLVYSITTKERVWHNPIVDEALLRVAVDSSEQLNADDAAITVTLSQLIEAEKNDFFGIVLKNNLQHSSRITDYIVPGLLL